MCGFLFSMGGRHSEESFLSAANQMHHRGPDGAGQEHSNTIFAAHKRLAIIDLNHRSDQPLTASDGKTKIVFNGEIYNYKELKKQFSLSTKTESDTEVLLELYLKLGKDMLPYLNGMFAFVIYNAETHDIFVARDRLGIKPLYIHNDSDSLILSSEIAPILSLIDKQEIDPIGLRQYLKLRTFFRGHTFYRDVHMFGAGSYLSNGRLHKYWKLEECIRPEKWNLEELGELVESAVKYRMVSDVSVGSFLSGGLDSSIITALSKVHNTWSVGFEEANEFIYAQEVADAVKTEHNNILITAEQFLDTAQKMLSARQEPLSVPNEVLIYLMSKAAKKKNTVILSGEGADELFFGYDRIFNWANNNTWSVEAFDQYYSYGSHQDLEIINYVMEPYSDISGCMGKVANFFQLEHLHGLLRRLDNSTMLASIEARVPFVDHRLIEYMYGVSYERRNREGVIKSPLKDLFSSIIPQQAVQRKKVGFPVPLASIFSGARQNAMDSWLRFNVKNLVDHDLYEKTERMLADSTIEEIK